ncbi:hypothetical protein CR513_42779, partial [Mucuna pruriens]
MQWFIGLPPRTIHTFNNLVAVFVSQFTANHVKGLEVADLFDIQQAKGLKTGQFSDSLALRLPSSIGKIRTRAKKHVEVEED